MTRSSPKSKQDGFRPAPGMPGLPGAESPLGRFFARSPDAIVIGRLDGCVVSANPAACDLFGYSESEFRALAPDALFDHDDPRVAEALEERRRTGQFRGRLACKGKDDRRLQAEVFTSRFEDESTDGDWIATSVRDATERERHDVERGHLLADNQSLERRLEAVLQQMPVAVFTIEADGRTGFNARAAELLGLSSAASREASRQSGQVLQLDGAPLPLSEMFSVRVLREGANVDAEEFLIQRADGTRVPILVSASPIRDADGRIVGGIGVCQDISDRSRIESALRASEHLLSSTFELLPMGVWIADSTGTLVRANSAAIRIWGGARWVGPEQFSQYRGWWADTGKLVQPDDWALARALRQGETSLGEVIRIECFDGSFKTIINSAIPLYGERGEIVGAVAVNEDITNLKETEAALKRAIDWREYVLGIVAHDLRNPIQSILLHLRLLLRIGERRSEQHQTLLHLMDRTRRMARLVEDLLDVTRLEAGTLGVERVAVDAGVLLDRAYQDCSAFAGQAAVRLNERAPDAPWSVEADPDRIVQVLDNLIENALKFTPAGGEVTIGAERAEDEIVFSVADSGIGMSRDVLDRMFERLWQGAPDRRGVGLGLGIAKMIVEAHGGRIWADSTPGRGTRVSFALPTAHVKA